MNHLRDTGRQADGAVQRLRSELREMNKQRHAELQRFESMRLSQQESSGQEVQKIGKTLAQMRSERDSFELQLSQKSARDGALEQRGKELENMLGLCRQEMERGKAEVARVRCSLRVVPPPSPPVWSAGRRRWRACGRSSLSEPDRQTDRLTD